MSNRALDVNEVGRLLPTKPPTPIKEESWPNEDSMRLIAEAVNSRREFIILTGRRFTIKYNDDIKAVFIKPDDGFAPCGWFNYESLKEV